MEFVKNVRCLPVLLVWGEDVVIATCPDLRRSTGSSSYVGDEELVRYARAYGIIEHGAAAHARGVKILLSYILVYLKSGFL